MKRWNVALLLSLGLAGAAQAAIDTYQFNSDAERSRYRDLTQELRCPKCQNQDIADSNAPIAADLRREIYRMLGEGKTSAQIIDFMVDRYGEFVRYKPALTARTSLLWFGPLGLLLVGGVVIGLIVRRRRGEPATPLTELDSAQRARLAQLLRGDVAPSDPLKNKEHP